MRRRSLRRRKRVVYLHLDFFEDQLHPVNDLEVGGGAGGAGQGEVGPDGFGAAGPTADGKRRFDDGQNRSVGDRPFLIGVERAFQ